MLLEEYYRIDYSEEFITKLNNECENKPNCTWTTYNVPWYQCSVWWNGPSGKSYVCTTCKDNILKYNNQKYKKNVNYEGIINAINLLNDKIKMLEEKIEILENNKDESEE